VPEYGGEEVDTEAFLPNERIDVDTALAAYTIGSAWVNHAEDETGSIEVGKAADLAIIDRDLYSVPPTDLYKCKVDMTLVDGKVVFDRD
jgi:predicted amidohydrolase YtcJ